MKILENENFQKYLEDNQWVIECESPLEVRHNEGSFATNFAARVLLDELYSQYKEENNIVAEEDENPQLKTFEKLEKLFNIMEGYIQAAQEVEREHPATEFDDEKLSSTAYDVWKKTYKLVFNDEMSVKIRSCLDELGGELNYYSDYGYNDDVTAFYNSVKGELDNLTKIFRPNKNKMRM